MKALKDRGIILRNVAIVEMPPPDMPAALFSRSVDAVISGEPFMAQSEMGGYGRVLFLTKDVWPEFISCVLAVPERMIRTRRADVQRLVDGIARSGKWLDRSMDHRMQAADFTADKYYHQDPKLLRFVLSKPPDRVKYTNLKVVRKDFEEIEALGKGGGCPQGDGPFRRLRRPLLRPGRGRHPALRLGGAPLTLAGPTSDEGTAVFGRPGWLDRSGSPRPPSPCPARSPGRR